MSQDILREKKLTVSLRSLMDVGLILSVGYLGFTVNSLQGEINSIVSLMEATSAEATRKISQMEMPNVQKPKLVSRKNDFEYENYQVGQVGALRATERIKKAFGGNIKIVVKPDKSNSFYNANIGGKDFIVTGDGNYLIVDGVYIPLNEDEYEEFKKSEAFDALANPSSSKQKSEPTPVVNKAPERPPANTVSQVEDKLAIHYPDETPGLNMSLDNYNERLAVFEKSKDQAIKFEAINPKKDLFVFFDVSCPSCKKFFKSIPVFLENGYNINLMMIDKTRKFTSEKSKQMMSIYCESDPKNKLIELLDAKYEAISCDYGKKFLESMTNAALLVGTVGTPAIFTEDAIPIYRYDDSKGRYYPIYRINSVDNWFVEHGL